MRSRHVQKKTFISIHQHNTHETRGCQGMPRDGGQNSDDTIDPKFDVSFFVLFFPIPLIIFAFVFSPSYVVVTQIRGHIKQQALSSLPSPLCFGSLRFYLEKPSSFSPFFPCRLEKTFFFPCIEKADVASNTSTGDHNNQDLRST